jgi:SAM-dependent methyltransferase
VNEPPPPAQIWNLFRGFMATQALSVAVALGVADELAGGGMSVGELAVRTGADADSLRRFLRALASDGVFAETAAGVFQNTPASELLRRDDPSGWGDLAAQAGLSWYAAFGEALHAARTGEATFAGVFGEDWWAWLASRPDAAESFNRAMAGGARARVERLDAVAWRDGETVVDVGGGNGTLLIELLRRRPFLRGVVFDLAEVASEAEARVAEAGLADRCDVVAGSFFDGVPEGADAYMLAVVLHDWDDDAAGRILRNVRAAAPDQARLLILDGLISPGNEPNGLKWLDLLMLVINRGRERTAEEWQTLLERAGFRIERIGDGSPALIEAVQV